MPSSWFLVNICALKVIQIRYCYIYKQDCNACFCFQGMSYEIVLLACAKLAVMVLGCPEWLLGHCKVVARWLLWCFVWLLGFYKWLLEHLKVFTCKLFARRLLWCFGWLLGHCRVVAGQFLGIARWLLWCFGWLLGFSRWLWEYLKVVAC